MHYHYTHIYQQQPWNDLKKYTLCEKREIRNMINSKNGGFVATMDINKHAAEP